MDRLLLHCISPYDFYICYSFLSSVPPSRHIDLVAPSSLVQHISPRILSRFTEIYSYPSSLRNLFSIKALRSVLGLRSWCIKHRSLYSWALFGSYRSESTSIILRHFHGRCKLIAIKQCIDLPISRFQPYTNLSTLHDSVFYLFFGYSTFRRLRLIQNEINTSCSDHLFTILQWARDPFNSSNIYTIGARDKSIVDRYPFIYPSFLCHNFPSTKNTPSGILLIGERTPLKPSWDISDNETISEIFTLLSTCGEQVFLRPRKNLTSNQFYDDLNPIVLDSDQHFDVQLNTLTPRLVLSFKSSACKVSAYYGFPSAVMYPLLRLTHPELLHLNYLFADGAPLIYTSSITELHYFLQSPEPPSPATSPAITTSLLHKIFS